ncbi:carboxymuconolactone decarboxylase family protein [Pseudomonadota bacterium]
MKPFQLYTTKSATPEAAEILGAMRDQIGFVPNVSAVLAESTPALSAFVDLNRKFESSLFTPTEREIIVIATAVENRSVYCVAGHTAFAHMQNVPEAIIDAVRNSQPISDGKLQALQVFTRALVSNRGNIAKIEFERFFSAGYTPTHAMEVVLGICLMTYSNLASNSIGLPLDDQFKQYGWQVPHDRAA